MPPTDRNDRKGGRGEVLTDSDSLLLRLEAHDADDGTKDLLTDALHARVGVGDNRWQDVVAALGPVPTGAAAVNCRALLLGRVDVTENLVALACRDLMVREGLARYRILQ